MEIKHLTLLVSIFYLLSFSTSIRTPSSNLNINLKLKSSPESPDSTPESPDSTPESPDSSPESPDSTPESPDSTPESPDSTPESPDSTPESPDGHADESDESPSPSASFTIMPGGSYPELEKICGATDSPVECVLYISPFLNNSVKIEPVVVLKAGINAAANLSKQAVQKAEELMTDPKTSGDTGACLNVCIENYDTISFNAEYAIQAIDNHDVDTLKTSLSADVTSVNTCVDVYDKKKSPMKKMDSALLGLVTANLEIATDVMRV